ncbi:hypothetical protein JNW90_31175 [Micromonospora sp. STR1s_5]|nr:hypothetical protein [Micromonospora sp. STR1s_5]
MSNTVIAIRAHRLDAQLAAAIEHTKSRSKRRIVLALHDEHSREPKHPSIIPFSSRSVEAAGVSTFGRSDWAWYLGDCAAYAIFDRMEGCDQLLMLEYDVKINVDIDALVETLFASADFIAHNAGFTETSPWSAAATKWFDKPCGSLYPIIGITRRLAEISQQKRREISAAWLNSGADPGTVADHMVHCEAFSPSMCADAGFPMSSLSRRPGLELQLLCLSRGILLGGREIGHGGRGASVYPKRNDEAVLQGQHVLLSPARRREGSYPSSDAGGYRSGLGSRFGLTRTQPSRLPRHGLAESDGPPPFFRDCWGLMDDARWADGLFRSLDCRPDHRVSTAVAGSSRRLERRRGSS